MGMGFHAVQYRYRACKVRPMGVRLWLAADLGRPHGRCWTVMAVMAVMTRGGGAGCGFESPSAL